MVMSLPSTSTIRNEVPEGSVNLRTTGTKITWAEVVQNTASATRKPEKGKDRYESILSKQSC
jgi:hypothetical protein